MTINDLFNKVTLINKSLNQLGVDQEYGIKFSALRSYESFECFEEVYTNIKTFIKAMSEETYFTNIDKTEVSLIERTYKLSNLEYEAVLEGETNGTHEKVSQTIKIYIVPKEVKEIY